jgi:hypothetical protein
MGSAEKEDYHIHSDHSSSPASCSVCNVDISLQGVLPGRGQQDPRMLGLCTPLFCSPKSITQCKYLRLEVFTAVTMKNGVFWDVTPVALVRTDVSEEHSAYFIRRVRRLLVTASVVPSSPIVVTLMKEALSSSETSVLTRATWRNIPGDTILQCKYSLLDEYLRCHNELFARPYWLPFHKRIGTYWPGRLTWIVMAVLSLGVRWLQHETDHSSTACDKVKISGG